MWYHTIAKDSNDDLVERFRRWTLATHAALAPVEAFLISPARDLAKFAIELLQLDGRIQQGGPEGLATKKDSLVLETASFVMITVTLMLVL